MSAPTWDEILRKQGVSVHPAATLFPMMSADELEELARDIDTHNLTSPLCLWRADDKAPWQLLDGRNRVAAMARLIVGEDRITGAIGLAAQYEARTDPWGFVVSANIHRRHLTTEKKREVIAALLKVNPAKSDRAIAKETGSSPTTVGAVRKDQEAAGVVSRLDTRVGSDGITQPASKPRLEPNPAAVAATRALHRELLAAQYRFPIPPMPGGFDGSEIEWEQHVRVGREHARSAVEGLMGIGSAIVSISAGIQLGEQGLVTEELCEKVEQVAGWLRTRLPAAEPVAPPIAATTEPQEFVCTRPKGCGYGGCKAEGRCLYAKPKPVVIRPVYSDAVLAEQERNRDIEASICKREGGCCWRGPGGCADAGRCRSEPQGERKAETAPPGTVVH